MFLALTTLFETGLQLQAALSLVRNKIQMIFSSAEANLEGSSLVGAVQVLAGAAFAGAVGRQVLLPGGGALVDVQAHGLTAAVDILDEAVATLALVAAEGVDAPCLAIGAAVTAAIEANPTWRERLMK